MASFKPDTITIATVATRCPKNIQGTPETIHMVTSYGPPNVTSGCVRCYVRPLTMALVAPTL